jgi:gas vesicle protein
MSENGNTFIAFLTGLIVGAFFGAVFALLYAPEAGEELRLKIQSGVETNMEKANLELDRMKKTIQEKSNQPQTQEDFPAIEAEV